MTLEEHRDQYLELRKVYLSDEPMDKEHEEKMWGHWAALVVLGWEWARIKNEQLRK